MASKSVPTILLVTGACATEHSYDPLISFLQKAGYPSTAVALPSCDPADPYEHKGESGGKCLLEQHLLPLVDAGKDVVVFAHSYGATSLSGANRHLAESERAAQGLEGGVVGLIYIAFALAPDGKSQVEYLGGAWPPFIGLDRPRKGLFVFDTPIETLFNDADSAETAAALAKDILPHSRHAVETPVSQPLWTDPKLEGRRVMIKTLQDAVFPLAAQELFAGNSGVGWDFREVDGGHEVFLTKPKAVADVMVEVVRGWQS